MLAIITGGWGGDVPFVGSLYGWLMEAGPEALVMLMVSEASSRRGWSSTTSSTGGVSAGLWSAVVAREAACLGSGTGVRSARCCPRHHREELLMQPLVERGRRCVWWRGSASPSSS